MSSEPLHIFDPRRNIQLQGFSGRAATTTIHDATETGVSISGIFQAAEGFAVGDCPKPAKSTPNRPRSTRSHELQTVNCALVLDPVAYLYLEAMILKFSAISFQILSPLEIHMDLNDCLGDPANLSTR